MKTEEFIIRLHKKGCVFSHHVELVSSIVDGYQTYLQTEWSYWNILKELTTNVNYRCDFDKSGLCFCKRDTKRENPRSSLVHSKDFMMCCCRGCYTNTGHFTQLSTFDWNLGNIAELFEPEIGFWREGKGCTLPRKCRSEICLAYHCSNKLTDKERALLFLLKHKNPNGAFRELKNPKYSPRTPYETFLYLKSMFKEKFDIKR